MTGEILIGDSNKRHNRIPWRRKDIHWTRDNWLYISSPYIVYLERAQSNELEHRQLKFLNHTVFTDVWLFLEQTTDNTIDFDELCKRLGTAYVKFLCALNALEEEHDEVLSGGINHPRPYIRARQLQLTCFKSR